MKIKKYFLMKNIWPRYELIASYFFKAYYWKTMDSMASCYILQTN